LTDGNRPKSHIAPKADHARDLRCVGVYPGFWDAQELGYEICGVTGSAKQYGFSGPGAINRDAGFEKDTKLTQSATLNLRLEMFNVFNHANFLSRACY
jgi:hypothetical protein